MAFSDKFDLLMNITNTSNSALARHLSFDPSFISRLRRGVRTPAKNENYIKEIAGYLARHCIEEYQRAALCKALRIPSTKLPVESEDKAELICHWLLEEKSDDTKSVESFLDELTHFKFKKVPPIESIEPLSISKTSTTDSIVFYGIEGKQNAVITFLCLLLKNKNPQTLLLYSDEDLGWLTDNREFTAKWAALLSQVIMRGNKIKIIHTVHRNLDEMLSAIGEWLPIYMTGAIEPYYYPKTRDKVLRRTLFIAPDTAAVTSNSIRNETKNAANFLFNGRDTIKALIEEYNNYLSLCRPLMRIFTPLSKKGYDDTLSEFEDEKADSIIKTDTLSTITMPIDVAESICLQLDNDTMNQILSYQQIRNNRFEKSLEKHRFTELINIPDAETILDKKVRVGFPDMLGDIELFYKPEEFKKHIQNIIRLLETYDNYNIHFVYGGEMAGYMLYVKDDVGVIVAKTTAPSVIFAINESNLTAAFWDYLRIISGMVIKSEGDRKDTVAELETIIEKLRD